MRIRAIVNGAVIDKPEEEAQALIRTGIYEAMDTGGDEPSEEPPAKQKRYRRRDMRPEP